MSLTFRDLNQYFTPTWAAEMLVARHFPDLSENDVVLEPSCGDGRFLMAIPENVHAYGVEIDPVMAEKARANSNRDVLVGDFARLDLPVRPTVVIGNPPFESSLIDQFMDRCYELIEYDGRIGFLLPVYYLQTASKVVDLNRRFSISQELLPRNLFHGMSFPIMWVNFTKARQTRLSGFFLHAERDALSQMHRDIRSIFVGNESRATCWKDAVERALEACGGVATLPQIYACVEGNRPSQNPWWREQVRKIAARHFYRVSPGCFSLSSDAVAAM